MMAVSSEINSLVGLSEPTSRVRDSYATFTKREKLIARFVLDHPEEVIHEPISALAVRLAVSEATVVRFCQRLGYRGYATFRILLARDLGRPIDDAYTSYADGCDLRGVVHEVFAQSTQTLQDTLAALDMEQFESAARAMIGATRIVLMGVAGSGEVARIAHVKLLRANVPSEVCTDAHLQALTAATVRAEDLVIGISYSGGSADVTRALVIARQHGARTLALVGQAESPVAEAAELVLTHGCPPPGVSEPATSRIVQITVLDALCACVATQRASAGAPAGAPAGRVAQAEGG